ncbi:MAG: GIY-YIG nuclease family protein [Micavibrio sp.]|nr:GIY-YIG nuclease family protein [Micavibrio sp.]
MPEYLFQIKGKLGKDAYSFSNWSFPPIWQDKVEAKNSKEAKLIIEELYGRKFPLRVLAKDLDSNEFLLSIKEIKEDDFWTKKLFETVECKTCNSPFKLIEKYQSGGKSDGGRDFCSQECANVERDKNRPTNYLDFKEATAIHDYVIYKITNKENGMCYIGQTKQAFTFRWYQHFYQPKDVKFHDAIMEFPITAWTFEVIEKIDIPEEIKYDKASIRTFVFNRETEYIKKFDCIKSGYNSVKSFDDGVVDENQQEIEFNEQK